MSNEKVELLIGLIEEDFKGWNWLLRNHGKNQYFAHINTDMYAKAALVGATGHPSYNHSFKGYGASPYDALFSAYQLAMKSTTVKERSEAVS